MDKKPQTDLLYVGLNQPIEIRRNLLESSKMMVQVLQKYQNSLNIRERKLKEVERLRVLLKELTILTQKLKRMMPQTDLRAAKPNAQVKKKTPAPPKPEYGASEIDRLDAELSDIESKLSRLS